MSDDTIHDGTERIRRLLAVDRATLPADGRPAYNRLIFETSPYLLQHAENPVDWYGWRDDAFAAAAAADKPIFLSIGYATCHWCHVMEKESFEDDEVAAVMNRHFVAIKVDREERPDIDEQYMLVAQMMTGSGGWPLNIIMTPDRRPFFAATYMPKDRLRGMPGLIEFLEKVALLWRTNREAIEGNCQAVMDGLAEYSTPRPGNLPDDEVAEEAVRHLGSMYDAQLGGFGSAPKFPMPTYLTFLLAQAQLKDSEIARAMAEQTLLMMRDGGIYDQLGYGYHRYSVDRLWIVPHFEKMLYDQALLTLAYLDAFQLTGNRFYREVAEEILAFAVRELKQPSGGFYSALDADSEGEEGTFYVWSQEEINSILGEDDGAVFSKIYSVTPGGNFEGKNILHIDRKALEAATQTQGGIEPLAEKLEEWRQRLFAVREERIRPLRDEKILTAWNGLAIAAAARCYAVTGNGAWLDAAVEAVRFIRRELTRPDGRLLRSHHGSASSIPAFLEDYAFHVMGLIELHQATLDPSWLDEALSLTRRMLDLFADTDSGGLFDTGRDAEAGLIRMKTSHDGVIPAGNSIAAQNLIRLGRITGDESLIPQGERVIRGFMGIVEKQPVNHLQLLVAADMAAADEVLTLTGRRAEVEGFLRERNRRYLPVLAVRFTESDGPATAQLCAAGRCGLFLKTPEELGRELDEV